MLIQIIVTLLGLVSILSGIIGFVRCSVHLKYHVPDTFVDDILSYVMIICGLLCGIVAYGYI